MRTPFPICLALLLAVAVVTQPVLASGAPAARPLESQRRAIAEQLVDLGRAPADAERASSLLTPEDLAVLSENPNMMQAAGSGLFWGIVLITGLVVLIVVLAASSNGFVMINA